MNRGVEFAVGADERVGADGDASLVEEGAVRVDVDLLAEADAESVVAEEGGDKYRRGGPEVAFSFSSLRRASRFSRLTSGSVMSCISPASIFSSSVMAENYLMNSR